MTAPSIATVATGMPAGICTVERSASMPSSVDDFTGMEKENDEDYGSFTFTDAIVNDMAAKRPIRKVTVDSSYLDFLASESEAEYNRNSQPVIEENDDDEDDDEAPTKRGFFRRK